MPTLTQITVDSTTYDIHDARITNLPLPITLGGTGASTAALARSSLGLGTAATYASTTFAAAAHTHDYSKVTADASITTGTVIGTVTVTNNGTTTTTTFKAPTAVDEKVKQDPLATNALFPIMVKGTSATVSVTGTLGFTPSVLANPAKGNIVVKGGASTTAGDGAGIVVQDKANDKLVGAMLEYQQGTASSPGIGMLVLGNATAQGTAGNYSGDLKLYGTNTYSHDIVSGASSGNKSVAFADEGGWVAVGGNYSNGTGEGSVSTPIYMDTNGELKPVTSIDASLISGDIGDEKVKQSLVSSGTNKYPILTKASTGTTTITDEAKFGANLYALPANAMIAAYGVTGSATDNSSGFAVRNTTDVKTVAKLYEYQDGTSTSVGAGALYLGNTDTTPTIGNARGQLYIASDGAGRTRIQSQATTNKNVELPDAGGYIAVGGNGSTTGEGSTNTPIYMDTNGELKPVTSISTTLYSDNKVAQNELASSNDQTYNILLSGLTSGISTNYTDSSNKTYAVRYAASKQAVVLQSLTTTNNYGRLQIQNTEGKAVAVLRKNIDGTASTVGRGQLILGNSTASGTAGNASGAICMFGTSSGENNLYPGNTGSTNYYAVLPMVNGYIPVTGNSTTLSAIGGTTIGIYMDSNGQLKACSYGLGMNVPSGSKLTDTNYYPTTWTWTNGAASGPTAKLTGSGMSDVSVAAIPKATDSVSGIVTTGSQTFAGTKTFNGQVNFAAGTTYNVSTTGTGTFNSLIAKGNFTASQKIIGKQGTVSTGNITTTKPSASGTTNQIMFYIPS